VGRPGIVCRATDHIAEMIDLIGRIEKGGFTYQAGGNLYFDVSKFPSYGELALLRLDELKAGARIEVDPNKRHPADFALWFTKSKFEGQAMVWDSPWGRGYPGWHIECSAMSMKYLGEQFDIHAGGVDHIPIHHTNEIAQSESATGHRWVNYWVHNEFLNFGKLKMSKSSGEFLTLQSVLDRGYEALDYRYFLMGAHYRSQLVFSWEALDSAKATRRALAERILALRERTEGTELPPLADLGPAVAARIEAFYEALCTDLAVPRALAELWGLLRDPDLPPAEVLAAVFEMDGILGLGLAGIERPRLAAVDPALAARVETLIAERAAAKKARDFARADSLRAELQALGVVLADSPSGTTWRLGPGA
jgi:cysteinyl-tRNA synthetase